MRVELPGLCLVADECKSAFQFRCEVRFVPRHMNRFARFAAEPPGELIRRSPDGAALFPDGHAGLRPPLRNGHRLSEEMGNRLPALQFGGLNWLLCRRILSNLTHPGQGKGCLSWSDGLLR